MKRFSSLFKYLRVHQFSAEIAARRQFHVTKPVNFPIEKVTIDDEKQVIKVELTDGRQEGYPWMFLQDNCTCSQCFHSSSQSRAKLMTTLDLERSITSAQTTTDKSAVKVKWSDGHEGTFSEQWLLARSFSKANQSYRRKGFRDDPKLVGSDHQMKQLNFQELLENKQLLLECLQELSHVGVVLLKDAPRQSGQLKRLAEKIGFFRTTHYGNEFTVRSIPDAVNLAYTSAPLNVHTDLPYYAYPPGVQALHCIRQFYGESDKNAGGESILVDGFIVADHMRRERREDYETLCNIPVEFYDIGQDFTKFYKIHHSPTFVTCPSTSRLIRIVYSNQQLSSYLPIDLENATGLYRAFKTFTDLCYHEKYLMKFKMSEGDVLIFDNWRFLHGRTGFNPKAGERHLEGCYFDWDEVFSTIRVAASELQQ